MRTTMTLLMLLVLFLAACDEQLARLSRQQKAYQILAEAYSVRQQSPQWNLPEGAVARLGKGSIRQVQYSPDGSHLAIVGSIGIWLYDTETYQEVAVLTGRTESVRSISFSPDGTTLASGSEDNTVGLWDVKTGEQKQKFTGYMIGARSLAFSPAGTTLASAYYSGTALLWKVD